MSSARPLERLLELSAAEESGELVCASPEGEVHIYLQSGLVAWATDSRHPFAFATHLREAAGIDPETFRQVLDECRREQLPLGETLVTWGLTSWDLVRKSLTYQIGLALTLLARSEAVETLFLRRAYGNYDRRLTFGVRELLLDLKIALPQERSKFKRTTSASRMDLARTLRASVEGIAWVEVLEEDRVVAMDPEVETSRTPPEVVRSTVLDGADFAALRSVGSTVVGLKLAQPRSVWCRVSAGSTFGAAVSAIWSVAGAPEKATDEAPPRPDVVGWCVGDREAQPSKVLGSFMHRAPDVLGTIVLAGDQSLAAVAGCGSSALESQTCLDIARRRRGSLMRGLLPTDEREKDLDCLGFSLKTMVSGEPSLWCFGAELEPTIGETVWLFLDRRHSQGLGWAYLTSLTRELSLLRRPTS